MNSAIKAIFVMLLSMLGMNATAQEIKTPVVKGTKPSGPVERPSDNGIGIGKPVGK